jgi:hypothetical protein
MKPKARPLRRGKSQSGAISEPLAGITARFKTRTRGLYQTCKRRGAVGFTLEELRRQLKSQFAASPFCMYCRAGMTIENVSLDHSIPITRGGANDFSNISFICKGCNKSKGDFTKDEYVRILSALKVIEKDLQNFTIVSKIVTALRVANSFRMGVQRRAKKAKASLGI